MAGWGRSGGDLLGEKKTLNHFRLLFRRGGRAEHGAVVVIILGIEDHAPLPGWLLLKRVVLDHPKADGHPSRLPYAVLAAVFDFVLDYFSMHFHDLYSKFRKIRISAIK
jgi:hypothetical protein